jgi:hypothetical protein
MSVRIYWGPSSETDIASYDLERASAAIGPFSLLINVPHNLSGPNYDTNVNAFFYEDLTGSFTDWYRLIAIDDVDNHSSPSPAFQASSAVPTQTNVVAVDHNYGSPGALRYQTQAGAPVEGALIRLYRKTAFDQGNTDAPLAITLTNALGNWVNPVSLTTGFTYVVQFHKEGLYGPDKIEIVV